MRPAPVGGSPATSQTSADAECWREAARLRREHRAWIIIWLARDNCYRAYQRTPGACRDTALSTPTAHEMDEQISHVEQAPAPATIHSPDSV
jgi:hypothetical protein